MPARLAATVADVLVEGDLLGHTTHGLALLAPYVADIEKGQMSCAGEPQGIVGQGSGRAVGWRALARSLAGHPGHRRIAAARAAIRRRHAGHTAQPPYRLPGQLPAQGGGAGHADRLASSDPAGRSVAPFGGTQAVLTPNPIAAGMPAACAAIDRHFGVGHHQRHVRPNGAAGQSNSTRNG